MIDYLYKLCYFVVTLLVLILAGCSTEDIKYPTTSTSIQFKNVFELTTELRLKRINEIYVEVRNINEDKALFEITDNDVRRVICLEAELQILIYAEDINGR